ncbi:hypothetical protein [Ehrlichia canis]|uniref:hypothetical protein n=1 Tax=Ehrlichia canis TaxID=944 RepID=UPI001F36457A|nr:hypothetical protein [Ehrlichia canis]UKC53503.1 hypothetical protein s20019040002_000546 [Ehrlichia canis]UKC54442.1 hypothetical protein s20026770001_000548 [Ehrlichia canis]UKC55378.1 hypothetical protein s21009500007_000548 [Ehrlichia canis]
MDMNKGLLVAIAVLALFVLLLLFALYIAYRKYKVCSNQMNCLSEELIVGEKRYNAALGKLEKEVHYLTKQLAALRNENAKMLLALEQSEKSEVAFEHDSALERQLQLSNKQMVLKNCAKLKDLASRLRTIVSEAQAKHEDEVMQIEHIISAAFNSMVSCYKSMLGTSYHQQVKIAMKDLESSIRCVKKHLYVLCDKLGEGFISAEEDISDEVFNPVIQIVNHAQKKVA